MRVNARDLEQRFGGNGDEFEAFIHDLIRAAARTSGISQNHIHWDSRTNAPDGGRDIIVEEGDPLGPGRFIPELPSLWSIKSGADGVDPNKLRKEVLLQDHPKVREALTAGWKFIWCAVHAAGHDQREAMGRAADEIAQNLGVSRDLIDFRWQDRLVEEANRCPNVIAVHLPDVDQRWPGVRTLREWKHDQLLQNAWADFGGRPGLVERVTAHLLGRGEPNVLHVAGLSGIGKTRAVFEACRRHDELHGVFYLARADLDLRLERAFRETESLLVVVDEVRLDEIERVASLFSDCADRVRIVTIGPAGRQRAVARPGIEVVPEPETDEDVLAVIRVPGAGLSPEVLQSIAARSGHDLRLALWLVRASLREPDLRTLPIADLDGVWARLMRLFPVEISNPTEYRQRYEALTVAVDVGYNAEFRQELQVLAQHLELTAGELLDCLNVAADCGLGLRLDRFFEAGPRALPVALFVQLFRRRLRDRLPELMRAMSPRLLKRFMERCQECPDDVREEVAAGVGGVFLTWLGGADVTALAGREASRVFQAWAEFDPGRGLKWLRREVERATPDQLRALDGDPDGSGGWRGRRQLVWLCQHLACFREHFDDCEAVLFQLARHETERVLNNSTGIWQSLFWPVLAQTEVPFGERFRVLLSRLGGVARADVRLVLGAATGALAPNLGGMPAAPRVVGGRVVPQSWSPGTHRQWRELREQAAADLLDAIGTFPAGVREEAQRQVIAHLRLFRELGLVDKARQLLAARGLTPELRRELVLQLERLIDFHEHIPRTEGAPTHPAPADLERWRVQDLTARGYHEHAREGRNDSAYETAAGELLAAPETLRGLQTWLDSDAAKGAGALGFNVGRRDDDKRAAGLVREWLAAGLCRAFAIGYMNGIANGAGGLPQAWADYLDSLAETNPELAVAATSTADVGPRGFERIIGAVDRLQAPASRVLRVFGYGPWYRELTLAQQVRVLEVLVRLAESGDRLAAGIGVDVIAFWRHRRTEPLEVPLIEPAFRLADLADGAEQADIYDWHSTLRLLCPHDPARVAQILVKVMTGPSHPWRLDDGNVGVLAEAGALAPDRVMEVIGRAILDRDRQTIFGVDDYQGLFESISLEAVRRWVAAFGSEHLHWLARHFPSPRLDAAGAVEVPPSTEWLFTECVSNQKAFEWFLMGRNRGAGVWLGDQTAQKRAEMAPFLTHPLPRVREWAEYQVGSVEREAEFFRRCDEEDERL
jgi:hypothetical protein